ncbi:hypothetical protein EST38_g11850 [Candolleomyces aberdarensis]|uniref:Uncharacterized protein n=1 Tax=Candolleomyces aberdarensis TaxID=2316362 RepID=A0A4Q2D6H3_9AGAR|nr:hypothetical protein EST38_g11850 [Candolleomyces aberdarensis]
MLKALFPIALAISAILAFANPIAARAVPAGFNILELTRSRKAGRTAISIVFSQFSAEVGPSVVGRNTSTCTLNFGVNIPIGYRFTFEAIDYRAFYRLERGVKFTHLDLHYEVSGALEGDFAHLDVFDNAIPSRCGGSDTLNLVSRISIDGGVSTNGLGRGYAAIDTIDSNAGLDTRFLWEAC